MVVLVLRVGQGIEAKFTAAIKKKYINILNQPVIRYLATGLVIFYTKDDG